MTREAWRFLETTGVLERALPELAEAVDRRRSDPFLIDPAQVLRFSLVERIKELAATDAVAAPVHAELEHPEWLLLAALILDTVGDDSSPVELARRIAHRLDLGAAAEQQIAMLVGDSDLFRAAATKVDGLDEQRVVPIAIHLDNAERARALYLLTVAVGDLTPWDRTRLDQLYEVVLQLLDQPDVTGLDARNLVERRRAEAIRRAGDDPRVIDRVKHAAPGVPAEPGSRRHRAAGCVRRTCACTWRSERCGAAHLRTTRRRRQRRRTAVAHRGGRARPPGTPRHGLRRHRRCRSRHPRRGRRHLGRRRRARHPARQARLRRRPSRRRAGSPRRRRIR